ncbi:MAG: FliI/YscN family ATPase [Treponemataceae bacterium]
MENLFDKYIMSVEDAETIHYTGRVSAVRGSLIESNGPQSVIGEICTIKIPNPDKNSNEKVLTVLAEVTGLYGTTVQLTSYEDTRGIEVGCEVVASGSILKVPVGNCLLGRVVDSIGRPFDGKGDFIPEDWYPSVAPAPNPLTRKPIGRRILTGIRAIDSLLAVGRGQRLGLFAGSGVGKSTLLGMIARNTNADLSVICLTGERGREVNDFIQRDLGEEGLKKAVVVVATGDTNSICRLRAAYTATAIAEYFRDQGKDVVFMMDNMSRFAHAQREIGLNNGEPPAQRGFPPSVFEIIPKLLERTGTNDKGSISAFYNVLVDGDDMDEPITDKVRGTLDGHIVLDRSLASSFHYPAIDVLSSISRLANRINGPKTKEACNELRKLISAYSQSKDLIDVGAYQKGNNPLTDRAVELHESIENFLTQDEMHNASLSETMSMLEQITGISIPAEEYEEI